MNEKIMRALKECEKGEAKEERRKRGWWDKECVEKKKKVKLKLRRWRRAEEERGRYSEEKREYKEMCERKKKEEGERLIRKAGEARTESKVWEIVNRERRKGKGVDEGIQMKEWKEYFMGLLGGVEERVRRGRERRNRREMEKEIEWEEINKIMNNLKLNRAMGLDGIPNEVWRYKGELRKWVWEMCKRVWRGERWPEGWKEGIIAPIVKKGEEDKVTDYRGVTLMPTLYKIYNDIGRKIKGGSRRKSGRGGVGESLKGKRADLEKKIARGKWGGVKLREKTIFSLAYADDIVLLAKEEDKMRAMLARTERYMDNKRLEVNVMKTKIMVFRKGGGRRKRIKWIWKGKKIEEDKEIKYLEYVFQANGSQDGH
ncbi:axoneme-associated protein, partial [Lasius niger]